MSKADKHLLKSAAHAVLKRDKKRAVSGLSQTQLQELKDILEL